MGECLGVPEAETPRWDRSSNGTLVESDAGRAKRLRGEDLRIEGSGIFRIGNAEDARPDEPIHYELSDPENS